MHEALNHLSPRDRAVRQRTEHGLFSPTTIQAIERAWIASLGEGVLMARAGGAVADAVATLARALPRGRPVVGLIGPGNNGGDALVALQALRARGYAVHAISATQQTPGALDARAVWQRWHAQGGVLEPLDTLSDWIARDAILIDGLFGLGLTRPLSGRIAEAIAAIAPIWHRVIAVDLPSGLDPWSGQPLGGRDGVAVRAGLTVTMIGDKPGLHTAAGRHHAGRVHCASLGIDAMPDGTPLTPDGRLFQEGDARRLWRPRGADTHKGSFGSVTVIGGATGTTGAALLAGLGAQAGGAGRVWIASPDGPVFDPGQPQLMTRALEDDFDRMDALCVGCGLGRSDRARLALARAITSPCALVLDADALNLLAAEAGLLEAIRARTLPTLLTPHPLEASRLLQRDSATIQADRIGSAQALARAFGASVILKGAGSVTASADGTWSVIDSGSHALATAGTGDVLAGLCASALARGLNASDAAGFAAWLHGAAGDLWHKAHPGGAGLSARDLPGLIVSRQQLLNSP